MTFWQALKSTYTGSIAFLIACPLLALVPVVFELLQHAAEVHIGMYDSIAAAKATEHHPLRMAFGVVKVMSLIVPGYWVTRFLAFRDARRAATFDAIAVRLFSGVVAFHLAIAVLQLFVLPQTPLAMIGAFAVSQIAACLIPAWSVTTALGNPAIGPVASARIMARQSPWTFAFLLVAILPLLVPHYAFGYASLVGGKAWLWPTLVLDALLVGWLSAVMVASIFVAASRAADARGIALDRDGDVAPRRAVAGVLR